MLLDSLTQHRVLFFSGKGGVGKTSLASATAYAHLCRGATVLLVSTDPAHNLGHLWDQRLGPEPTVLLQKDSGTLYGVEIDPQATAQAHLQAVRTSLRELMPEHLHRDIDQYLKLAELSPGTGEAALVERIGQLIDQGLEYADLIIFDTAPSGHTAQLMALPKIMGDWVQTLLTQRSKAEKFGAAMRALDGDDDPIQDSAEQRIRRVLHQRQQRLGRLRDLLSDHQRCGFILALTPEKLPVTETLQFHHELGELGIAVLGIIVNRVTPETSTEPLRSQREVQDRHIADLRDGLSTTAASAQLQLIPAQYPELVGLDGVIELSRALSAAPEPGHPHPHHR